MKTINGLLIAVLLVSSNHCSAADTSWRAGAARARITPDGPYWMGGYASRRKPSDGTLLDLNAKALAVQDPDGAPFVFVTLDLLVITPRLANSVADRCKKQFGLPRTRLLLNCSHTHTGPEIRLYREQVHNIPAPMAAKMQRYVDRLATTIVAIVGRSIAKLQPARLTISQSQADFAINRRNNREADVPRLRKAGALVGPVDHDVPVLRVTDQQSRVIAILFGYACHNTTLSIFQTSGDYAGFAQQRLEQLYPDAQAMFMMGAAGDQNPSPRRTISLARQHGRALADAVQDALKSKQRPITGRLRADLSHAHLEFQPHADRNTLTQQTQDKNQYKRWKARYLLGELDAGRQISRNYELPVQAVALGREMLLLAIGGETVVDYSRRFKTEHAADKGPLLWVAGYSNDVFGYLPSRRVLREGGYEGGNHMVYTKFPGPFTETVETRVFEAIDRVLKHVQSTP
ncbi:MAG: neutral/alkaline non-lysosomal ceramidase N-terminal domain-containing protein [Planctomycetaceae bacterium]